MRDWFVIADKVWVWASCDRVLAKSISFKKLGKLTILGSYTSKNIPECRTRITKILEKALECSANVVKLGEFTPTQTAEFFKSEKLS